MLEWLKRHAWKACIRQKRIPGSNPGLSAGRTGFKAFQEKDGFESRSLRRKNGFKAFRKKIGSNPGLSAYYYDGEYLSKGYSPSSFLFLYDAQINAKRSCNGILANVRHSSVPLVLSSR